MAQEMLDHARNGDKGADRIITMMAASGALQAQRDLLTLLVGDPARPEYRQLDQLTFEEAVRAEILARFCAFQGDSQDVRRLAGILHHMAVTTPRADDRLAFATETAELLRTLADEGDGEASELLAKLVGEFPEVRPALVIADAATVPPPVVATVAPPIVQTNKALGDILGEVLASASERRSFFDRFRSRLSGWAWRVRLWWWNILEGVGK